MSNAPIWQYSWNQALKSRKPGRTRAFPSYADRSVTGARNWAASGSLAERLVHAALDRLGGIGCDLLSQRAEFLALRREGFKLLPSMSARQFDPFRKRLRGNQLAGEIESRVGVDARRVDHFLAIFRSAFGGGRIGGLENVGRFFSCGLHLLVGVFRLSNTPFRELAESGRHFDLRDIEFRHFEFRHFKSPGGGLARLHFRGCSGVRHGTGSLVFDVDHRLITHWAISRENSCWHRRPLREPLISGFDTAAGS